MRRLFKRRVELPTYYLHGPWDGGRPDRRDLDVSRRLLRLHKTLPLQLLDDQWRELTRRQHCEPDELARLEEVLCDLEAQYGDPRWLQFMQPVFLDDKPAVDAAGQPNKRWILLIHTRYLAGGSGPVSYNTGMLLYSHAHGGLLGSVDDEVRDNPAQILWAFRTLEDVGNVDAATIYGDAVPFEIHSRTGTLLKINDTGELELPDADIAVAPLWPELAELVRGIEKSLITNGRNNRTPTWDINGTMTASAVEHENKIDNAMAKLMRLRAKRLSVFFPNWHETKRTLLAFNTVDKAIERKYDWSVIDETLAEYEVGSTARKMLHHGPIFLDQSDPDHFIVLEELLIGHTYTGPIMANGTVTITDSRTNTKLGTTNHEIAAYTVELGPDQQQELDCIAAKPEDTVNLRFRRLGDNHILTLNDLANPTGPKAGPQTTNTINKTKEQFATTGHTGFHKVTLAT